MISLLLALALSVPATSLEVHTVALPLVPTQFATTRSPSLSVPYLPAAAAGLPLPFGAAATSCPLPGAAIFKAAAAPLPFAAAASSAKPSSLSTLSSLGARLSVPAASAAPEGELTPFWTGSDKRGDAGLSVLGSILETARGSKTAVKVLEKIEALTRVQGPLPIEIRNLPKNELGQYDYAMGILSLERGHASGDPRLAAATLIHELVHVLQHAGGQAPAEALELELEAHLVSIQVMDELGVPEAERDSFSQAAKKRLLDEGPAGYENWLAGQLSGKLRRSEGADDLIDQLESDAERWAEAASRGKRGAERLAVLAERAQSDAEKLKTQKGRAAYARFAQRVRALLQAEHLRLRRN